MTYDCSNASEKRTMYHHPPLKLHFLDDDPQTHSLIESPFQASFPGSEHLSHILCHKSDRVPESFLSSEHNSHIIFKKSLCLLTHSVSQSRGISNPYHHCLSCSIDFTEFDALLDHYKTFHNSLKEPEKKGPCEICDAFTELSSLDLLGIKSKNSGTFKCDICNKSLSRKASLLEHLQRHKGLRDKECPVCHKKFYATSLWRHMSSVHPQENKLSHKCVSCPKTFAQRYKLRIHEKTHLPYDERPFVCDKCSGKRFSSIHRLKSHIKNIHGCNLNSHLCPDCGLTFSSPSAMQNHQETTHSTVPLSVNPLCKTSVLVLSGEPSRFVKGVTETGVFEINNTEESPSKDSKSKFSFLNAYQGSSQSVDTLEDFKRFPCQCCDRMFKTEKARRLHWKNVHFKDKAFDCKTCGSKFSSLSYLKDHERIHSKEKPFECSVCQKTFRANRDLTRHFRTHTGEKPYKCNDCDKRFGSPSNLSEHRTLHTGRLPYSCGVCQRKFRLWSSFSKHKRKCHSTPELNKENQKAL